MSRVFEALEKASKENKATISRVPVGQPLLKENPPKATSPGPNGTSAPVAAVPSKSWRERAEELLFGWDLRSYDNHPIVALEKGSPAAEQYKILREQVKRWRAETGARTLCITSPVKRDGKSTVAANLAAAIALDYGERVILIDCDLRNPQIHNYFGIADNGPGLSEYLTSTSNGNITSYLKETSLPGLRVLPAGKARVLSSELLAAEKMKLVMDEIRQKFPDHQIIIDGPPVLSTPDPLVLARQVDGILMVIRAGKTPRNFLSEAMETLKSDKIIGVVLNGAELGISSKYYYYETAD